MPRSSGVAISHSTSEDVSHEALVPSNAEVFGKQFASLYNMNNNQAFERRAHSPQSVRQRHMTDFYSDPIASAGQAAGMTNSTPTYENTFTASCLQTSGQSDSRSSTPWYRPSACGSSLFNGLRLPMVSNRARSCEDQPTEWLLAQTLVPGNNSIYERGIYDYLS
jgi:hypothetical protein